MVDGNRTKILKKKMPKHGHYKISPIICLCSLKIMDKFFSFS